MKRKFTIGKKYTIRYRGRRIDGTLLRTQKVIASRRFGVEKDLFYFDVQGEEIQTEQWAIMKEL